MAQHVATIVIIILRDAPFHAHAHTHTHSYRSGTPSVKQCADCAVLECAFEANKYVYVRAGYCTVQMNERNPNRLFLRLLIIS